MRFPEFIKENGKIGFIAPSYGCATGLYRDVFDAAVYKFEKSKHTCVLGPNCYESSGIGKSNTPGKCGAEINDFFIKSDCNAIIACGGGETMCEDLEYVDFEGISEATPKWYMGFSDNTNLTFLLPVLCDMAAIYGNNAATFGMNKWHKSLQDDFDLLHGRKTKFSNYDGWEKESLRSDDKPFVSFNITEPYKQINVLPFGRTLSNNETIEFEGRMLGGCLDVLSILCGTRFDRVREFNHRYMSDGVIWFLEACDLNPMDIKRTLWQLDNAGWFDNAKGFIIGRTLHYDEEFEGLKALDIYKSFIERKKVPAVLDTDLGHISPMMPFVSGAMAKVTVGVNSVGIDYGNLR